MSNPTTIRLYDEDLLFLRDLSKQERTDKTRLIKEIIHNGIKKLKIENAMKEYQKGFKTIRECAEICKMEYRDFLNELAQRNLIGGNVKLQQTMLKDTMNHLK